MAEGTGPPLPLGNYPNGVDISHPNYAIDSVNWHEPPEQFAETYMNTASMTLRTTNDLAYKSVGNATSWNRYILFGYHAYDHCFQFETQWERMKTNQTDALSFIWATYSYLISRNLTIPKQLDHWANDIARPHLQLNKPSSLRVETIDPRSARRTYDEADLMEEDDLNKKLPAKDDWTPVPGNKRTRPDTTENPPPPPATTTPQVTPIATTPENVNTQENLHPQAVYTPQTAPNKNGINFVSVNDGTIRVTMKWKPDNYDTISIDETKWNLAATDTIHYILQTVPDAIIFPWMNGATTPTIPTLELSPDNLIDYIAPRITNIESIKMYVFSFRLCLSTNAGKWIGHKTTKQNMEKQNVGITISNSSSDSGETISIAGYIFFKHPKHTQRMYYLAHLRRQLPDTTPFFDIGYHRRTPTGQDIPHLSIKCGENHVGSLTEILSSHLDGTHTAVFLGRLLLSKMSTAEVDAVFQTHADYMTNTRIITMAPTIQNLDLIRKEHRGITLIERNTRTWASELKDTNGESLRCDADNGGDSRRAQLLVPSEHLDLAKKAFQEYKESISTFNQREADFTTLIQDASPPQAIYVPTAKVHNNLALIQQRSPVSVWENAPASVRSPDGTGTSASRYRPPTLSQTSAAKHPLFPNASSTPAATKPSYSQSPSKPPHKVMDSLQEVDMTDETATTHSQMTKSMTTQNKFAEIEANIRRHQHAVEQHKKDLEQVNERALTTLTLVEKTAADVQHLTLATTDQITSLRNEMRQEAATQAQAQLDGFERMTALILQLTTPNSTPDTNPNQSITEWRPHSLQSYEAQNSETNQTDQADQSDSDHMSTETIETDNQSSVAASPVKKKKLKDHRPQSSLDDVRINLNRPTPPHHDQETSAQNKLPSTPDAGAT